MRPRRTIFRLVRFVALLHPARLGARRAALGRQPGRLFFLLLVSRLFFFLLLVARVFILLVARLAILVEFGGFVAGLARVDAAHTICAQVLGVAAWLAAFLCRLRAVTRPLQGRFFVEADLIELDGLALRFVLVNPDKAIGIEIGRVTA